MLDTTCMWALHETLPQRRISDMIFNNRNTRKLYNLYYFQKEFHKQLQKQFEESNMRKALFAQYRSWIMRWFYSKYFNLKYNNNHDMRSITRKSSRQGVHLNISLFIRIPHFCSSKSTFFLIQIGSSSQHHLPNHIICYQLYNMELHTYILTASLTFNNLKFNDTEIIQYFPKRNKKNKRE